MSTGKNQENTIMSRNPQRRALAFARDTSDGFQRDVRARVQAYFRREGKSIHANREMIVKTVLIMLGWSSTYVLILTGIFSPLGMLGLAIAHGFFAALIGMNIAHDALHGSFSGNNLVNRGIGVIFNLIGANDDIWKISHNVTHHTYTNIPEYDGDIRLHPVIRLEPTQRRWWIHRFQYIYAYLFYSLATLFWVFIKDYRKLVEHQSRTPVQKAIPPTKVFRLLGFKVLYYIMFLALPMVLLDLAWYWILFGFVVTHLVEGLVLAVIFMLAHIIEGTEFPEAGPDGKIEMAWADLQMHTTANFAVGSWIMKHLTGGLNMQIEHHLFPHICHTHYPRIAPLVRQAAADHNLPYIEHRTFFGAIASHGRMLKKFGRA
jgi:linoleoyl-CoA desaturase